MPALFSGKAMMSVDTLSQLAMERTMRSRDAVQLMGSIAEKYGFYGAGSDMAESVMDRLRQALFLLPFE